MENKNERKDESVKVVKEERDSRGKRVVTIQKGVKKETRLVHDMPSHLRKEE